MNILNPMKDLAFEAYRGKEIHKIINVLAQLRIGVFREYPYLYDANPAEERECLILSCVQIDNDIG